MEIPPINPEQIANKPEIIHSGDYDIVFSPEAHINVGELEQFLDTIDKNLVMDLREETLLNISDQDESDLEEQRKSFIFDSNGKKYFVKQKWYDVRQQNEIPSEKIKIKDNTFGSILNEFNLTPEVEKVLSDQSLKEKVKAMGFDEVKLIPVLAGVVRRSTGQKFLIYDFAELGEFQNSDLEKLLVESFRKQGIEPDDLEHNLRCDANNKRLIYLLDIEGYKRV